MATYTTNQLKPAIGQVVSVRFEGLEIICTITDTKASYGNIRVQIVPLRGEGSQWVELGRVLRVLSPTPVLGSPAQEVR